MDTLLLALACFLLIVIAIELYVLIHRAEPLPPREDDGHRIPIAGAGQTINVNLGPQATGAAAETGKSMIVPDPAQRAAERARLDAEEKARLEAEAQAREMAERDKAEREEMERIEADKRARLAIKRQTPSGAYVITCPECGMENSSYRTECFNCGKQL